MIVDIRDVERAAARLKDVAVRTPLIQNAELDERVGKIRGAYNLMSQLDDAQRQRGVVAWSSGNHAQGVAAAGQLLDIKTTIVMPEDAPRAKLDNTRKLGGEVVTYDRYGGDREAIARDIAADCDATLVPSYDHPHIIAGQGTVGLEIAQQLDEMGLEPDQVLICCGGGGLSAGSAVALKHRFPNAAVYAVEPVECDDTARSLMRGERVEVAASARSICDALQAHTPGELTFAINRELIAKGLAVSDEEAKAAMRFAFRYLKLVVEPGGAVALAAALTRKVETADKTTLVVISGGNVDIDMFAATMRETV